jgi:hypothetical protein
MSRKSVITIGAIVGSFAGGYLATLLGAGAISYWSLIGSTIGGIVGIWVAFKLTN